MRIAIMQPYFIPYAGYFRLFSVADLFIVYDCVQFIRRGWIHRNRLSNHQGEFQWLTLPLKKAPREVLIKDLQFAEDSNQEWISRLTSFPTIFNKIHANDSLLEAIKQLDFQPLEYIVKILKHICENLKLSFNIAYSSSLNLPETLRGEDRIIEIVRHYKGDEYINLAGGRQLYQPENFKKHAIKLNFLSDYQGSYESILSRVLQDDPSVLRKEIISQSTFN